MENLGNHKLDGFPTPNSHVLVGNVDWGESLAIVSCEFHASTVSGARRRATSAWLAGEIYFLEVTPPVIVQKAVYFPMQFLKRSGKNTCILWTMKLLMI